MGRLDRGIQATGRPARAPARAGRSNGRVSNRLTGLKDPLSSMIVVKVGIA
jgi:hypothetical protein